MSERRNKQSQFYSQPNILFLTTKIQGNVLVQTGHAVAVEVNALQGFMIAAVELDERGTVGSWNHQTITAATSNISSNLKYRKNRIKRQSRGSIPRPEMRPMNDSVRGTQSLDTLHFIGRPSKNRNEANRVWKSNDSQESFISETLKRFGFK